MPCDHQRGHQRLRLTSERLCATLVFMGKFTLSTAKGPLLIMFPIIRIHVQYHAFNCAVCLGTLIFRNPKNPLAAFALSQIDATISLYTSLVQMASSKRILNNLRWLLRLRAHAVRKLEETTGMSSENVQQESNEDSEDENVELIGLKTRLIERASKGAQTARTISVQVNPAASDTTESTIGDMNGTTYKALQELLYGPGSSNQTLPAATNEVVNNHESNDTSTDDFVSANCCVHP